MSVIVDVVKRRLATASTQSYWNRDHQTELQEPTLLGLSDLKFKKDSLFNKFCSLAFWLILVPLMGGFFGLFIQYLPFG